MTGMDTRDANPLIGDAIDALTESLLKPFQELAIAAGKAEEAITAALFPLRGFTDYEPPARWWERMIGLA